VHTKTLTTLQTTGQRSKLILARPIRFAKEFSAVLAVEVVNASLQRIECRSRWIVRLWRRKRVFADRSTRVEVRDNNRQRVVSTRQFSLRNLRGVSAFVFNTRVLQHDIVLARLYGDYVLETAIRERRYDLRVVLYPFEIERGNISAFQSGRQLGLWIRLRGR